jgi:triosephosphate isomerase
MSDRTPIIGGNWKMHTHRADARELATAVAGGSPENGVEVVLAPPHPWLTTVAEAVAAAAGGDRNARVAVAGQDCSPHEAGAHTGQVSAGMLRDAGATWAIVGHSERRHELGESDELVGAKLARGLAEGLGVILCVGELEGEREAGRTEAVVARQLDAALDALGPAGERPAGLAARTLVVAYEPVWAIGTGRTAGPDDAQSVHAFIRSRLAGRYDAEFAAGIRLQYGGSVKPGNAAELFAAPDVDGFLVGGASLAPADFLAIIDSIARG